MRISDWSSDVCSSDLLGSEHEPVFGTTTWPTYASPWIPPPKAADVRLAIMPGPDWMHDGMLGTKWFGDRTWEWDYRAGTLRLLPDGDRKSTRLNSSH